MPPVAVCGPHHTHTLHILQQCGPHSTSFLARSRSLALRSSPRLCSACLARCTLATSPAARSVCLASAGSRCSPPRLCCSRFAHASPAASRLSLALRAPSARFARQLACCSLRSPCLLLTSHCCACSAHRLASCSRFACRLARGCSPLRLRLLASLAVSPTRPPHSPSPLAFQHFWHGRQWMGFIEKRKRNEKKRKETCVTQKIAAVGGEDPDPRAFCLVFST